MSIASRAANTWPGSSAHFGLVTKANNSFAGLLLRLDALSFLCHSELRTAYGVTLSARNLCSENPNAASIGLHACSYEH